MPEQQNPLQRAWDIIGHIGNAQFLFQMVAGFGGAAGLISYLPGGLHPPHYWALAGLGFFGSWLVAVLLSPPVETRWRRMWPPRLEVKVYGGPTDCHVVISNHERRPVQLSVTGQFLPSKVRVTRRRPFTLNPSFNLKPNQPLQLPIAEFQDPPYAGEPDRLAVPDPFGTAVEEWLFKDSADEWINVLVRISMVEVVREVGVAFRVRSAAGDIEAYEIPATELKQLRERQQFTDQ